MGMLCTIISSFYTVFLIGKTYKRTFQPTLSYLFYSLDFTITCLIVKPAATPTSEEFLFYVPLMPFFCLIAKISKMSMFAFIFIQSGVVDTWVGSCDELKFNWAVIACQVFLLV